MLKPSRTGNILGELTAEADAEMLKDAFYESRNYRVLALGTDFRFVVGRRGTGKSALFEKLSIALKQEKHRELITERPTEEIVGAWHYELGKLTSRYLEARRITRLTWKVQVLSSALEKILSHYKSSRLDNHSEMLDYKKLHSSIFKYQGICRSLEALRVVRRLNPDVGIAALPELIANHFELSSLQDQITEALQTIGLRIDFMYDGLDEGWVPTQVATGLLGGLAKLASEFKETQGIHCMLFVRDNMFRALAEFDDDYSRNIEGNTLRLHWDEDSLLNLVALRLRAAFEWGGENDIRAWNRFAKRGLEGREGFRKCLKLTLYRPRDLIALLNGAYQVATTAERNEIIDSDIEVTATKISQARLSDLYKEYDHVLPGLRHFAEAFRGRSARMSYGSALAILEEIVTHDADGESVRDFALLRTGTDAFSALYSVGFVGVQDGAGGFRFCHDGSNTDVQTLAGSATIIIHPCYWRGLSLEDEAQSEEVMVRLDDENDVASAQAVKKEVSDLRLRKLGTVIAELGNIPEGITGAHDFEKWVYDATRYLFAKGLSNITWKPNPGLVQQRDIVGTINSERGFWRRISKYNVSQFIIEAKNFREIGASEFRQAWSYLNGPYGRCLMIVSRSDDDAGITEHERALVKEGYDNESHKLVLLVPAKLLQRALRKMQGRNEQRDDYIDNLLQKRLDNFERVYIHQKTPRVPNRN